MIKKKVKKLIIELHLELDENDELKVMVSADENNITEFGLGIRTYSQLAALLDQACNWVWYNRNRPIN